MIDPVLCQQALEALKPFDSKEEFTPDELVALKVVREGIEAIARGQDITPPADGAPLKKRLIRHVVISYFAPGAPRPPREPAEPPTIPEATTEQRAPMEAIPEATV